MKLLVALIESRGLLFFGRLLFKEFLAFLQLLCCGRSASGLEAGRSQAANIHGLVLRHPDMVFSGIFLTE
jgi:hypothetical protein